MQECQAKRKEKIAGKSVSKLVEKATNRNHSCLASNYVCEVMNVLQLYSMISAFSVSHT